VALVKEAQKVNGGVDIAFDCAGNQRTFDCAMESVRALGTVVNVALWSHRATVDLQQMVWKEIKLVGSSCFSSKDMREAIVALASGQLNIDEMISSKIKLEDIVPRGIEALTKEDFHTKILIDMSA
jgi:threonine dehydrogenase-like Zn-dependent dehydrogenase